MKKMGMAVFLVLFWTAGGWALTYEYVSVFSGAPPAGASPWLTATFADIAPNTVQLTMSTDGLTGDEFVTGWYFNLDPVFDPSDLTISFVSALSDQEASSVETGTNAFKAPGDGLYDILFSFPTSNSSDRFITGETSVYNLSLNGITENSFGWDFLSEPDGGHGPFVSAAKVQGIDEDDLSGSVAPVPEPGTLLLLGSGLVGLAYGRRRRKG